MIRKRVPSRNLIGSNGRLAGPIPYASGSKVVPMSKENLLKVIGLLVSDQAFKLHFDRNPKEALANRQLHLDDDELQSLMPKDGRGPRADVLDDRIKRRSDDLI